MSSNNLLITGGTGNIGRSLINYLTRYPDSNFRIGVRNINSTEKDFDSSLTKRMLIFDFERPETFPKAFELIDLVFLLRPPQISNVRKYFEPLLEEMKKSGVKGVVFLSVQGVEKSKVIPHNKIERLIISYGFEYIFLRPSYFMQNITTTLWEDIRSSQSIVLPSGKAKFNWVDVENIAELSSIMLNRFDEFKNASYEITGYENYNFYEIVRAFEDSINKKITYQSVNPLQFYLHNLKQKQTLAYTNVKFMLHYLPRFQKEPVINDFYESVTRKKPTNVREFLRREREKFHILSDIKK